MIGHVANDIIELCNQIVTRTQIQHGEIQERNALILAILEEAGTNNVAKLFSRLKELKTKDVLLRQMEERQTTLTQSTAKLRSQLEKAEAALEEAHRTTREGQEKATASGRALTEVRSALNFLADTVNKALLYTENLERDEKLNRAQII